MLNTINSMHEPEDLGEPVFEVEVPFMPRWRYFIPGGFVIALSMLAWGNGFKYAYDNAGFTFSTTLLGLSLLAIVTYVVSKRLDIIRFRMYQHGISKAGLTETTRLRFEDIDVFTRALKMMGLSGTSYVGYSYIFTPSKDSQLKPIKIDFYKLDDGMEKVQEYVSKVIAKRMARILLAGKELPWISKMYAEATFLTQGIKCSAFSPPPYAIDRDDILSTHFPVSGSPRIIPYEDIVSLRFATPNSIRIRAKGGFVTEEIPSTEPNFFSGLALLQALVRTRDQAALDHMLEPRELKNGDRRKSLVVDEESETEIGRF